MLEKLIVENVSNAPSCYVSEFQKEVDGLPSNLKRLINFYEMKIVLADKISDVAKYKPKHTYKEEKIASRDDYIRGLCSDAINAICIFSNTTSVENIGFVLYHEIGHLIDYFECITTDGILYSATADFIKAYRQDIKINWKKISKDKNFRLIHYMQDSTPLKLSDLALGETFASCFAKLNGKKDDIDNIEKYFNKTLQQTKRAVDDFYKSASGGNFKALSSVII